MSSLFLTPLPLAPSSAAHWTPSAIIEWNRENLSLWESRNSRIAVTWTFSKPRLLPYPQPSFPPSSFPIAGNSLLGLHSCLVTHQNVFLCIFSKTHVKSPLFGFGYALSVPTSATTGPSAPCPHQRKTSVFPASRLPTTSATSCLLVLPRGNAVWRSGHSREHFIVVSLP